ncbi:DUF4350 domain-containing protein [Sphingomonas alba]|uniref:GldG family protein n=1 Tax=Sphingomonas alba TaxID=2908208 RepID=A0ABT0RL50_9SPHN|nr:GldG family protein [Sphingomonas alba]
MKRALAAAVALIALVSCRQAPAPKPPERPKPDLFLLTSLPIAWSEQFSLDQPKSPVMTALEKDYRVKLIDLPSQLPKGAVLLAAQPRALPAEELVKLDAWVRAGGRLLLLADPMLEWPSDLPLGDKRRAPTAFADTGLLQHWGLRLDAPEHRGPVQSQIGGRPVQTASPGLLVLERGRCRFSDQGFVGRCAIGRGQVTVIADADFLNVGTDDPNLFALESQLASLTR